MPYDSRHVATAFFTGIAASYTIYEITKYLGTNKPRTKPNQLLQHDTTTKPNDALGIESTIGNTPLIVIKSLSALTGCTILAKCEFLNGAGNSPKDRVAASIITQAEEQGLLTPYSGDTIYEGTVGSTGISLATLARARGYKAHIVMPNDQSHEKSDLLKKLGAIVDRVDPAPIVDPLHFVNRARSLAASHTADPDKPGRGLFADQFETSANWTAHFSTTGPEIYTQAHGDISAFVAGAGTGGTLSGVALYLRSRLPHIRIVLADPQGSGLYNKVRHGVMFHRLEREGTRRRAQVDSVVEGIGLSRSTRNFEVGEECIDDAVRVSDEQAKRMARWLCERDGIFVGSSSAVNCELLNMLFVSQCYWYLLQRINYANDATGYAAVETAMQLGPGHRVVTILCDSGMRHLSKFWKQVGEIGGEEDMTFDELIKD